MPHQNFLRRLLIIAVFLAVIIFLNGYFLVNFFQNVFYEAVDAPSRFLTSKLLSVSKYGARIFEIKKIIDDNIALKQDNAALSGKIAQLENIESENQFLRSELGVAKKIKFNLLLVQIVNIQKTPLSSTILINKGKLDGVKKSMPVITSGNVLVGIIDEVFDNSSRVLVIDDPRTKVNVRLQESNILASTKGILGGGFGLDLIMNTDKVQNGETVVTNGLDGLPESLLMGHITSVASSSSSLFKGVEGKMLFDSSLGSELFVILNE